MLKHPDRGAQVSTCQQAAGCERSCGVFPDSWEQTKGIANLWRHLLHLPVEFGAHDKPTPDLARRVQLATSKGPRPGDRVWRAIVVRSFSLEQRQHSFGAVGGPRRNETTLVFAK